jgi:hypothetical protein
MILRPADWVPRQFRSVPSSPDIRRCLTKSNTPITRLVLMQGHEALIFINGHWQGMSHVLAFNEAESMSKDDFYRVFGTVADRVPATAWQVHLKT